MTEIYEEPTEQESLEGEFGEGSVFLSQKDYPEEGQHDFDMKRINRISQVFHKPEIKEAFKSDGIVKCMDGGTEGGLRMAGSGILLPRKQLALPRNHPMADFFQGFGIELTGESEKVLLPDEDYLDILRDLTLKNIIKGISAHAECGAANGDLGRVFQALGVAPQVVAAMMADSRWQSVVDAHAAFFSETLANELKVNYSWIPLEGMSRESHGHKEEAFYVDLIGGTRPDVAFDSSKLQDEVPNGFTIHPALSDWTNVFHRIEISLGIAKVEKRFTPQNPFVVFIIDDPLHSRVTKEIIQGIKNATKKFGDCVVIKQVAPNLKN
ncbi:MAG: hypothetical protein WCV72_01600 [Patescibacteria group bacterium]